MEQLRLTDVLAEPIPEPPIVLDPKLRKVVAALMAQALVKMHEEGDESDDRTSQ